MLRVPAEAGQLAGLNQYLLAFWQEAGLPDEARFPFELALEEIFMNVVMHGSRPGQVPEFVVSLAHEGDEVVLAMSDTGIAFDPLDAPNPDIDAAIEDRPIGGLGIYLLREMMDSLAYVHEHERNHLTLRKRIAMDP